MPYRAAVFDLDGTLLDTLDDLAAATNHALASQGLPGRTTDEVRHAVGNGIRRLVERVVPKGSPQDVIDATFAEFNAYYATHCNDRTAPYPGVRQMVDELRAAHVSCAVISNKADYAVQELMELHFDGWFDLAQGQLAGVALKPAPDSLLAVLARLGVDVEDAVYVGDSEVDVATAANAGCDCIGCAWGFRGEGALLAAGATRVAQTPADVASMVLCHDGDARA